MTYPRIGDDNIEKMRRYIGKEISLLEHTDSYIDPSSAPKGKAAERDDWEQYGGYPGRVEASTETIRTTLVAVVGNRKEDGLFPEYIIGKDDEGLKAYPFRTWAVSWIQSVHGANECLWSIRRGQLHDKEDKIRKISSQEFEEIKKDFIQIV